MKAQSRKPEIIPEGQQMWLENEPIFKSGISSELLKSGWLSYSIKEEKWY